MNAGWFTRKRQSYETELEPDISQSEAFFYLERANYFVEMWQLEHLDHLVVFPLMRLRWCEVSPHVRSDREQQRVIK